MKKILWNPLGMFISGLFFGLLSKTLDIYTVLIGDIFSQIAIWILIGVLIAIYSNTKREAMLNILPFCLGMLLSYYAAAALIKKYYSWKIIAGWAAVALVSPILAYFTWMTKEKGRLPKLISLGVIGTSVLATIVLYEHLRFHDIFIHGFMAYFLFFKKVRREGLLEEKLPG